MKKSLKKMFVAVLLVALICSSLSVFAAPEEDGIAIVAEDDTNIGNVDEESDDLDVSEEETMTEDDEVDSGNGDNSCVHSSLTSHPAEGTCTTEGNIEYWECEDCGQCFYDEEKTRPIEGEIPQEMGNHDIVKVPEKEATCQEDGIKEHYKCTVCNTLFKDESGTDETVIAKDDVKITNGSHKIVKVPASC